MVEFKNYVYNDKITKENSLLCWTAGTFVLAVQSFHCFYFNLVANDITMNKLVKNQLVFLV